MSYLSFIIRLTDGEVLLHVVNTCFDNWFMNKAFSASGQAGCNWTGSTGWAI